MWHPCRLTEISRGDALNYLKVSCSVIVLTVVYPVGMDKSVSMEPQLEYSDGETNAAGCFCTPPFGGDCGWLSPERHRSIKERRVAVLNLFFFFFPPLLSPALNDFVYC